MEKPDCLMDGGGMCDGFRDAVFRMMQLETALVLIAAPMRPDGTWNRDREACRRLAEDALKGVDTTPKP